MTNIPAAIAGHFADIRTIKTRSAIQMIIEVPIEQGADIIAMFGFPQPADPVAVAVARINLGNGGGRKDAPIAASTPIVAPSETASATPDKSKRQWSELSLAQQIGIRCNEQSFQRFLREKGESNVTHPDDAATYVRFICGVDSRRDIAGRPTAKAAWLDLEAQFQVWLADPVGA